jgi:hypothetical protein
MEPQWDLWLHLFRAELFAKKAGERGARRAVHVGSCVLQVRSGRGDQHILAQLISSNSGWHDGWFYLHNDGDQLPRYSGRVLVAREENWSYGVVEDEKPKLEPLLNALWRLCQCGLTAGMVAAAFHHRRVMPLTQHRLWLDQMTPEAPLEGSRMSHESLSLNEVTRRARWMVGSFKPEDVDRFPMRPTQGFEPLVSVVVDVLEIARFQIFSTDLVEVCVHDLSAIKETRPPLPEDRVAREARRLLAAQQKEEKDAAKKRQVRKAQEQEALKKRRCQQSLDGLPLEESPSKTVSGENDDDGDDDDDALSRYDAATGLADLPDVRPFLEPIGGLTS